MAGKKRDARPSGGPQADPDVVAFLCDLDHPMKGELEALRRLFLGVSPDVREGIKWNSPSFRTTDWFATINVHKKDSLRLILHTGAKKKAAATTGLKIADPAGLLTWLAKDRCLVTFVGAKDVAAKKSALEAVVRQWVRHVRA